MNVLLVCNHSLTREGLRRLLLNNRNVLSVMEAKTGEAAIQQALSLRPELILIDLLWSDGLDDLSTVRELKQQWPEVNIILITVNNDDRHVKRAIVAGVRGYLLKSCSSHDLYEAMTKVMNGAYYFRTQLPEATIKSWLDKKDSEISDSVLTDREKEIVQLALLGYTNNEIAIKLSISVKTVENHKTKIMDKLGIKSKHEFVQYGIRNHYFDTIKN